jgi:hypothetical protein
MASTFSWLDTSERDRRRALDVIDLFEVRDTRDELGMGSTRDAWADLLVPATSTIQTRARYFLFVPWIYQRLARRNVGSEKIARRARQAEIKLISAIKSTDSEAVPIGALAGAGLQRLPSSIYWNGMRKLRILLSNGSVDQFHRSFSKNGLTAFGMGEDEHQALGHWNPHLPKAPAGFPDTVRLELEREEAEYLRAQWILHCNGSLMAFLLEWEGEHEDDLQFPWQHPGTENMHATLRGWLNHARNFSTLIHGAALLYNLMLAEQCVTKLQRFAQAVDKFKLRLVEWQAEVENIRSDLQAWDRKEFWAIGRSENPRLPVASETFLDAWFRCVFRAESLTELIEDQSARELISNRERSLKRSRARLWSIEHLQRWSGDAGSSQMDFRWGITKRLVRDILDGLEES